ncbi:MAG: GNAT family N-acetyltransferase [Gammaproteobacteria bacterium]|nr:GNAT family N-acetyltransferase [Gammaproteobacteria bacterium]
MLAPTHSNHFDYETKLLIDCPKHMERLCELWYNEIGKPWIANPNIERARKTFLQHLNRETLPLTWVALHKAEVIGMASLRENDGIREDLTPWLGSLIVDPRYRKKKVGEALVVLIKQQAKFLSYSNLHLFAFDQTLPFWYEKLGFQTIAHDEYDDHPVTVMVTDL